MGTLKYYMDKYKYIALMFAGISLMQLALNIFVFNLLRKAMSLLNKYGELTSKILADTNNKNDVKITIDGEVEIPINRSSPTEIYKIKLKDNQNGKGIKKTSKTV